MKLDDLLHQTGEWLKGVGPNSEIVISSRMRLARNLKGVPFAHWSNKKESEKVFAMVKPAILESGLMKDALFLKIQDLSNIDKQFLLERHLVSRELITGSDSKAVAISPNEVISVMVNEEDHLRIQAMESGFNLKDAWEVINSLDDELSQKLDYAFSVDFGYLSACPTNTGTGLRASVMAHLPALVLTKQIEKVLHAISKIGLTARGFYGEGTEASGNFFQISNQVTLGLPELEVIDNLGRIIRQVIEHELSARQLLTSQQKELLHDRIWRSYGTLKSAYIITSKEAVELLSSVRLGVDLGMINGVDGKLLNELLVVIQPAHLQKLEAKALDAAQRDVKRADLIRQKLTSKD